MDGLRVAAAALPLLLAACSHRVAATALDRDIAPTAPQAAVGVPPPPSDPLQAALLACDSCLLGDDDVDPACAAARAWADSRTLALGRPGGKGAVAQVGRHGLEHTAPGVRLLAARAAAFDLPASATALVALAAREADARVLKVLWALLRGSPAQSAPQDLRTQAALRLSTDASPSVQAAAVTVLDVDLDAAVLLAALATATDLARAAACEKLYAERPRTVGDLPIGPLRDPATPSAVRTACLVGAARALCTMDQGDARPATEAVFSALRGAPPWQLVSALACAKGMSDEARQVIAAALRPLVDEDRVPGLARAETVRTLAALHAPAAWFVGWKRRYSGSQFGVDGLIAGALRAVGP